MKNIPPMPERPPFPNFYPHYNPEISYQIDFSKFVFDNEDLSFEDLVGKIQEDAKSTLGDLYQSAKVKYFPDYEDSYYYLSTGVLKYSSEEMKSFKEKNEKLRSDYEASLAVYEKEYAKWHSIYKKEMAIRVAENKLKKLQESVEKEEKALLKDQNEYNLHADYFLQNPSLAVETNSRYRRLNFLKNKLGI